MSNAQNKLANKTVRQIAGKSLQEIHDDTVKLVDEGIARSIDGMLSDVEKAVKQAMVKSIGLQNRFDGWEFSEPNGRKSPARICAEAKFKDIVEQNASNWDNKNTRKRFRMHVPKDVAEFLRKEWGVGHDDRTHSFHVQMILSSGVIEIRRTTNDAT